MCNPPNKKYRINGAKGALLDEYERALNDLYQIIEQVNENELTTIVDADTEDEDCRSIQTILTHLVFSGYYYLLEIRRSQGADAIELKKEFLPTTTLYIEALKKMFKNAEMVFEDYPEMDLNKSVGLRWKNIGNIDLLLEHAIVHILRHRRQIERFLIILRTEVE